MVDNITYHPFRLLVFGADLRDAIAQYLGTTDPSSVKTAIASLEDRVASLEGKLTGLGRLVG